MARRLASVEKTDIDGLMSMNLTARQDKLCLPTKGCSRRTKEYRFNSQVPLCSVKRDDQMIVMICDGEPSSCENVIEQRGFGFPGVPVKRVQGNGPR